MNYLKYSYLLFALAIIFGIIVFNKLSVLYKEKISAFSLPVIIFFIVFLLILFFIFLNSKENYFKGKTLNAFFAVLIILFFILSFLSAGQSFCQKTSQIKLVFQPLNNKEIKNFYKTTLSGRICTHPVLKNNCYYFDLDNSSLVLTENILKKCFLIKNIGMVSICVNQKDCKNTNYNRDDMVTMDVEKMKTSLNKIEKSAITFYVKNICKDDQSVLPRVYKIRQTIFLFLSNKYKKIFSDKEYAFTVAVLLGNQNVLSYSLKDSFTKSGLYHMLSISGLHISVLFSVLFSVFSKTNILFFKKHKNILTVFCFILLAFFNLLIGLKAAIFRASVFFVINALTKSSRKYNLPINIFFMTVIIMLLVYPDFLSNAGFILSFTATAGIIIISPLIRKILFLLPDGRSLAANYFVKIFIVNISVSLFIVPLSYYFFGGYYLLSFLTNIICVPIFYLTLLLLFGGSLTALLFPFCGDIFLRLALRPAALLITLSDFFSGFSSGFLKSDFFGKQSNIFLYYLLLMTVIFSINYYLSCKYKMKLKNVV